MKRYLCREICLKLLALLFLFFFPLSHIPAMAGTVVGFLLPTSGLGDQSFNDMTYAGLMQAKGQYGFSLIREQCDDFTPASRRTAMEKLLGRGANIVVANGWEFRDVVVEFAGKNLDRIFVLNDAPLSGLANVMSTVFGQHEGAFMAGVLAGLMTQRGHVGFIGGRDMPVIKSFYVGFAEGVASVDKAVEVHEVYLQGKSEQRSGFADPELGFEQANMLYDLGVDIIFSAAGLSGNGVLRAAGQRKLFAIGVDADQDHMARGYVLTSVMKRLDRATYTVIRKILEGQFQPGIYSFNLKNGGVALSPMTYTKELFPREVLAQLHRVQMEIVSGKRSVTDFLQTNPAIAR